MSALKLLALHAVYNIARHVYDYWHLVQYGRDYKDRNHCPGGPDHCCNHHTDAKNAWGSLVGDTKGYCCYTMSGEPVLGFKMVMTPEFEWGEPKKGVLDKLAEIE